MDVFDAIADPVRRSILLQLKNGPQTAGEIASGYAISRPAISRHLRVLRETGMVSARTQGRTQIYQLDIGALEEVEQWLNHFRSSWPARLDALKTEVYRTRRERMREVREATTKEEQSA